VAVYLQNDLAPSVSAAQTHGGGNGFATGSYEANSFSRWHEIDNLLRNLFA
jgi:hypothetical protein